VSRPSVSHARKAEEEIPTRLATSLMRSWPPGAVETDRAEMDGFDEFFPLDITDRFP